MIGDDGKHRTHLFGKVYNIGLWEFGANFVFPSTIVPKEKWASWKKKSFKTPSTWAPTGRGGGGEGRARVPSHSWIWPRTSLWRADHTGKFKCHMLAYQDVIVWKVVCQHIFLNIIPKFSWLELDGNFGVIKAWAVVLLCLSRKRVLTPLNFLANSKGFWYLGASPLHVMPPPPPN